MEDSGHGRVKEQIRRVTILQKKTYFALLLAPFLCSSATITFWQTLSFILNFYLTTAADYPLFLLLCVPIGLAAFLLELSQIYQRQLVLDSGRAQSGSQDRTDEEKCQSWFRDFQLDYLKHGISNTDVQKQYLQKLAEEYQDKYNQDGRWVDALKAFTLFNAIDPNKPIQDDSNNKKSWEIVSKFLDLRSNGIIEEKRNYFFDTVKELRKRLYEIRKDLRSKVADIALDDTQSMIKIVQESNDAMVMFAGEIVDRSLTMMGAGSLPCDFSAVGIGSLGRGEATPYSDLEYLFLIENKSHRQFFERLAVLTYFFVGALKETKLTSIAVKELNGDAKRGIEEGWFVDGRPFGFQIDGITTTSDNVPTRAARKWKVQDSGGFITTPKELLKEYNCVLVDPTPASLKGDITSMLMFTRLLYSTNTGRIQGQQESEKLLLEFSVGRDKLNLNHNRKRRTANFAMLMEDLEKFAFHPEFDPYSSGFTLNMKTELYRFPSIVLLDLATLLKDVGTDSWTTLSLIRQKHLMQDFGKKLERILALACFSRLKCYLAKDSHADEFKIKSKKAPTGLGDGELAIGFDSAHSWEMEEKDFFSLCNDMLQLQLLMKKWTPMKKGLPKPINELLLLASKMKSDTKQLAFAMANYYCSRWTAVIEELESYYRNSNDYTWIRTALAFSYLKTDNNHKALKMLHHLKQDLNPEDPTDIPEQVNVCRLFARCLGKSGESDHEVQMAYIDALRFVTNTKTESSAIRRIHTFLLLEYGLFLTKVEGKTSESLDVLFDVLPRLILDAATRPNCNSLLILTEFKDLSPLVKLDRIGNATRELAHCVYSIGKLFKNTDGKLAHAYYKKAHELGMQYIMQGENDSFTQVTILRDIGAALENEAYLKGALKILQMTSGEHKESLEAEIIVSVLECAGQEKGEASVEYQNELEQELNSIIMESSMARSAQSTDKDDKSVTKSLLNSKRTEDWYEGVLQALRKLPKDITSEETSMLKTLREKLGKAGKSTQLLEKFVEPPQDASVQACPNTTTIETQTLSIRADKVTQTDSASRQDSSVQASPNITTQRTQTSSLRAVKGTQTDSANQHKTSQTRMKLTELTHINLPEHQDISVREDELAVAGWDDHYVHLFKLV